MPKAKFVPFDSVEHQNKRPGVLLTSLVDGDTGAPKISSGVAEFAVWVSGPPHLPAPPNSPVARSSGPSPGPSGPNRTGRTRRKRSAPPNRALSGLVS